MGVPIFVDSSVLVYATDVLSGGINRRYGDRTALFAMRAINRTIAWGGSMR